MSGTTLKIGCIGTGAMGGALMNAAALSIGGAQITVFDANTAKCREYATSIGANAVTSIADVLTTCDYVFLAVKPNVMPTVLAEIAGSFGSQKKKPVLVSIAAGVSIATIKAGLGTSNADCAIVRLMPNMPALVGQGMIALSTTASETVQNDVTMILAKAGIIEPVAEHLMDAVTGVSGSGPAFAFMFIEAMADAAVRCGMPRAQAITYAAQTLKGSAETVLATKRNPAELKDSVCSPAGTTIEGVATLEAHGFRSAIIEAVTAAYRKSQELGKK